MCLKACTPSSLARFIHWLTAPSVTPRASAISVCFQPCSFNSKARKRLPSRQLLAWLDNVFSIVEYSIPLSLHLYAEISNEYPNLKAHFDEFAPVITSDNRPYGLHRAREERFFLGQKIVSLRKTARPRFTYTDFPCYVSQSFFVLKPPDIDLKYLVGLLNSRLCHFWLDRKGKKQGAALQIDKAPLLDIPIRTIDFSDPEDVARHDRMAKLVEQMLTLHRRLEEAKIERERTIVQAQVDATDRQIDRLVYELYGLTDEEIAIVEEATAS